MKLIILGRDGVINQLGVDHVRSADEWQPLPGALEAIAQMTRSGYRVVVVTNQSGIARKYFSLHVLHQIHQKMQHAARQHGGRIEAVFYCPHAPSDDCDCRLPKPGLLHELESRIGVSLLGTPVVSDQLRDLQAAMAVGAKPVLLCTGKGQNTLRNNRGMEKIPIYNDLASFANTYLQATHK